MDSTDSRPESDRLVATLFGVTLLHGIVILGITFSTPEITDPPASPTLDVSLVVENPAADTPDDATHLAQVSQRGSGNDAATPSSAASPAAADIDNLGQPDGDAWQDSQASPQQTADSVIAAEAAAPRTARNEADPLPTTPDAATTARLMVASAPLIAPPDLAVSRAVDAPEREAVIAVDTREAAFAGYLQSWKQRVEQVGTVNFPDDARRDGFSGNPVLEVAINRDGTLREVTVRRPSGHPVLDEAAVRILRLAAPFDAFPDAVARDYDVLRFMYEWQFIDGDAAQDTGDR